MATPGSVQKMAAGIFSDMVMEEAIRDKTIQVQKQMKDEEGNFVDPAHAHEHCAHQHEQGAEDDDEFQDGDEEEEKIMRSLREKRMAQIKGSQ